MSNIGNGLPDYPCGDFNQLVQTLMREGYRDHLNDLNAEPFMNMFKGWAEPLTLSGDSIRLYAMNEGLGRYKLEEKGLKYYLCHRKQEQGVEAVVLDFYTEKDPFSHVFIPLGFGETVFATIEDTAPVGLYLMHIEKKGPEVGRMRIKVLMSETYHNSLPDILRQD